jgi:hypothetical protein
MKHQTLAMAADQSFENYRKPIRRDELLKTMEAIVPWSSLCTVIEPHYPKAGNGRPPIGLERMLRIHFDQHWFNLADMACERQWFGPGSGCGHCTGTWWQGGVPSHRQGGYDLYLVLASFIVQRRCSYLVPHPTGERDASPT